MKPCQETNVVRRISDSSPTFLIRIVRSDHYSVQGYIRWLEEDKYVPFRSSLELFHLLETGIRQSRSDLSQLRSWDFPSDSEEADYPIKHIKTAL
ncbi:hypothetical protein [Caproiciproducens faecalis]|uniref:Uncharacterized protein n=1 Tax=Caproiciproducens faecalis TaxID=2820301 RepID=A0ABS7DK13_9FIRM|nr:hypothetical protein [Caproiciproducens faecalis]MBW7571639.1 hypothetical protein [Caproiciproducens faecalis]